MLSLKHGLQKFFGKCPSKSVQINPAIFADEPDAVILHVIKKARSNSFHVRGGLPEEDEREVLRCGAAHREDTVDRSPNLSSVYAFLYAQTYA